MLPPAVRHDGANQRHQRQRPTPRPTLELGHRLPRVLPHWPIVLSRGLASALSFEGWQGDGQTASRVGASATRLDLRLHYAIRGITLKAQSPVAVDTFVSGRRPNGVESASCSLRLQSTQLRKSQSRSGTPVRAPPEDAECRPPP